MSRKVVELVYSKVCGSMARKAILVAMADRANDDGTGIWVSKARIAQEVECTKQTVITAVRALLDDNLLEEVGKRKCVNGHTVEYNIQMSAVLSLPDAVGGGLKSYPSAAPVQNHTGTGPELDGDQSKNELDRSTQFTPPVKELDPNRPRTAVAVAAAYSREEIVAICDRILAVGGPGMADPSKEQTPRVTLGRRIHQWLANWDLELDILPVVAAKTAKRRGARPLGDLSNLEPDIAYHHAQRLRPVPTVELSNERAHQSRANGNSGGYGRRSQDIDAELESFLAGRGVDAVGSDPGDPRSGEDIVDASYEVVG